MAPTPQLRLTATELSRETAALGMGQGRLISNQKSQHWRPFEMRLTPNNLLPIPLILLTSFLNANQAAANDQGIRIESNNASTVVQFCGIKDTCQFIEFSTINTTEAQPKGTKRTQIQDQDSSLTDQLNIQLFGL